MSKKDKQNIENWSIPSEYMEELKSKDEILCLFYSESVKRLEYEQYLASLITKRLYQLLSVCAGVLTVLITLYLSVKNDNIYLLYAIELIIYALILCYILVCLKPRKIVAPGTMPEIILNKSNLEYLKTQDTEKAITYNNTLLLLIKWNNDYIKEQARRNKSMAKRVKIILLALLISALPLYIYIIFHTLNHY